MRLLDTTSLEFQVGEHATFIQEGYAILSHRWVGHEITMGQLGSHVEELRTGTTTLSPQLLKIRAACETARSKGIKWMWIDSCCIDKRDMVELTESINSMYKWYRDCELCMVYLYDVKQNNTIATTNPRIFNRTNVHEPSEWFFRGWTLQELLAPRAMEFYDKEWTYMGTKKQMKDPLSKVTGIEEEYLTGDVHFRTACIAKKMSWMARRTTTREEDIAYSMVGLFGITMVPIYGEGMRAFERLQEILISCSSMDETLFAWRMPAPDAGDEYKSQSCPWEANEWGLLAASPKWFAGSAGVITGNALLPPRKGSFTMTPNGLEGPVGNSETTTAIDLCDWVSAFGFCLVIPFIIGTIYRRRLAKRHSTAEYAIKLRCFERGSYGKSGELLQVGLYLRPVGQAGESHVSVKRVRCTEFGFTSKDFKATTAVVPQPSPVEF